MKKKKTTILNKKDRLNYLRSIKGLGKKKAGRLAPSLTLIRSDAPSAESLHDEPAIEVEEGLKPRPAHLHPTDMDEFLSELREREFTREEIGL